MPKMSKVSSWHFSFVKNDFMAFQGHTDFPPPSSPSLRFVFLFCPLVGKKEKQKKKRMRGEEGEKIELSTGYSRIENLHKNF